jgi:serine/threonine protein phosphatase PrpC
VLQPPLICCSCTLSHIGKVRKLNEDAYLDRPDIGLWVVADGMGGHAAGDMASRLIVSTLNKLGPLESLPAFIDTVEEHLQLVNRELITRGLKRHQIIGSTVVVLLVHGHQCAYMWAGDSRAYLLRDGVLTQLTIDHSQVEIYVQLGIITREEAATHPTANMIIRAIGAEEHLTIDRGILELQENDRYMLCSDGLYKHVTNPEIAQILPHGQPSKAAHALIEAALAGGGSDNVTVSVMDITTQPTLAEPSPSGDDEDTARRVGLP